jgi:hypothetical protein
MARFLRGDEPADAAENPDCDAAKILVEAASRIGDNVPLVRTWSTEEANWQCTGRDRAVTAAVCVEDRRGMMSGYAIETSGTPPMLCVLLDDILWGDLGPEERAVLAKAFVEKSAALGAKMVITPVLSYADMQPLASAGFRKTRRLLHAYLTLWDMPLPESLPAIYVDIF